MENNFELLRTIFAVIASVSTLGAIFHRALNKERIGHARQITEIIDKSVSKTFNLSALEQRVNILEKAEKENQEYMRESFSQVHARLDQIYSIIASQNKQ
jgi:chorismate synthase